MFVDIDAIAANVKRESSRGNRIMLSPGNEKVLPRFCSNAIDAVMIRPKRPAYYSP